MGTRCVVTCTLASQAKRATTRKVMARYGLRVLSQAVEAAGVTAALRAAVGYSVRQTVLHETPLLVGSNPRCVFRFRAIRAGSPPAA